MLALADWVIPAQGFERPRLTPPRACQDSREKRNRTVRPLAQRRASTAVPEPRPPRPLGDGGVPPWAVGAGVVAVVAAAIRAAWLTQRRRLDKAAEYAQYAQASRSTASPEAARAALQRVGYHLAASNGGGADQTAEAVGPLLLAAESGGLLHDTAAMSLEQLQRMAMELYMLIQQMEMQLQEQVENLMEGLPQGAQAELEELSSQMEGLEERLAQLKGVEHSGESMAVERAHSELQWRVFEVVTSGRATERQRRSLRSLLYNLTTQRQLLRRVEQQEALRERMRRVERRIAELLREEQRQPVAAGATAGAGMAAAPAASRRGPARVAALPNGFDDHINGHSSGGTGTTRIATGSPSPPATPASGTGQLLLQAGGTSIPHTAKAATGGEDAFFISSRALGVADGVGGWAAQGIDPALYPRALVAASQDVLAEQAQQPQQNGVQAAASGQEGQEPPAAALALLEEAHRRAQQPGSSTAVMAVLLPGGRLSVANLGDCELRVVRDGTVVFATQVQEHEWNMPLQLSWPDFYDCGSRPADADVREVALRPGDVVVAGSDGLWDNLHEAQLLEAVAAAQQQGLGAANSAQQLANELAQQAHRQSRDPGFASPWAMERQRRAEQELGPGVLLPAAGGKEDDVTAVVAVVTAAE